MEALKGIHAILTTLFALLIIYMGWPLIENLIESISDPILNSIIWITFILMVIVMSLGVPTMIAFLGSENDATIISMTMGCGAYFIGVLFMIILTPIIQLFTGGIISGHAILTESFHIQIMTLLWVVAVLFTLIIIPVALALAPNMFESTKKLNSLAGELSS